MHPRTAVCALVGWLTVALPGQAAAQNPFALPGSPTLGPPVTRNSMPIAFDAAGNTWFSASSCMTPAGAPYSTFIQQTDAGVIDLARNVGIVADYNIAYAPSYITLYRQTCDGQPLQTLGSINIPGSVDTNSLRGAPYADPAGRYCLWFAEGSRCITAGSTLTIAPAISFSSFDPIIANAQTQFPDLPPNLTASGWSVSSQVLVPDGRMFALVSHTWVYAPGTSSVATYSVHTVVEISTTGAVTARIKPWFVVDRQNINGFQRETSLLAGVRYLLWDADLDAVIGYPLIDVDYGRAFNHQFGTELVTSGTGIAVIPVARPGAGLIDLTATFRSIDNNQEDYIHHDLVGSADGTVRVVTWKSVGPTNIKLRTFAIDPATVDADRDGAPAALEIARGSSDYVVDSDGDGASDGFELLSAATSPADAAQKPPTGASPTARYAYSTLLAERIPLRAMTRQSIDVPWVCGQGVCYDAAGQEKVRGPTDLYPTRDGKAVFFDDGTTIGRIDVATGTMTPFTTHAAVLAASGGNPDLLLNTRLPLIPVDYDRVLVGPEIERLVVVTAGAATEIWDPRTAFCDAQRGTCVPALPGLGAASESIGRTRVLGYDPVNQRALMAVHVTEDEMVVSVGLDAKAFVIGRRDVSLQYVYDYSVVGFFAQYHAGWAPRTYARLGTGGYLATYAAPTSIPQRFVNATLDHHTEYPLGYIPGPVGSGWGTSAFTILATAPEIDDNLFESVLYEHAIEPGDVLSWTADTVTPAFGRSGRRGGFLPFASTPFLGDDDSPTSFGLAADGRMCATFAPGGGVIELVEPDAGRVPTKVRQVENAIGAVDCMYDDQDRLVVLADGPPRLLTYAAGGPVVQALAGIAKPRRFVRSPAGGYRIASSEDVMSCVDSDGAITRSSLRAAGLGWALDGRLLVVEGGAGTLRAIPDAAACTEPGEELGVAMADMIDAWEQVPGCLLDTKVADVVQRPDGRVVMQLGEAATMAGCLEDAQLVPHTWNPRTGYIGKLTPNRHISGAGLVLVPGGTWCDPWEDVLPAGEAICDSDEPDGGDGSGDGDGDGGGGCCEAGTHPGSALGSLLLCLGTLAALARRRARSQYQ